MPNNVSSSTSKLVMSFLNAGGQEIKISYAHADPEMSTADIGALMAGLIANGSIFENPPVTSQGAQIITTVTTDIDFQ